MDAKQLIASDVRRLREELNERQLRERCLHMAISASCGQSWGAASIVKAAGDFAAFVARAPAAKRKK